jgi:hypothetical protein
MTRIEYKQVSKNNVKNNQYCVITYQFLNNKYFQEESHGKSTYRESKSESLPFRESPIGFLGDLQQGRNPRSA